MSTVELLVTIFFMILGTLITRFLPFIIFPEKKELPKLVLYLSKVLPFAVIGMLVVYCLKDVSIINRPYGIPELISILIIVLLHLWKKNTLLSIGAGTIVYMVFIQYIFI